MILPRFSEVKFPGTQNYWKGLPWVPEPQNLNERNLVRGKERRKKGLSFLPNFFLFIIFLALVPRVGKGKTGLETFVPFGMLKTSQLGVT